MCRNWCAALQAAVVGGVLWVLSGSAFAGPPPCTVGDNGTGTVDLPPANCGYVSPEDLHMIIDGLDPGTEINVSAEHFEFLNVVRAPGGLLGGEIETFQSIVQLSMEGTGILAGFARTIFVPLQCEVHTGPRTLGDPVQQFDNEMVQLQGQIFGDPDFDSLTITAGRNLGLPPSEGHTTLTDVGGGNFTVDSFFDITYRIDFQGAPGSILEALGGITERKVIMAAGDPVIPNKCEVVDNGTGTVDLPPDGCGYVSPQDLHMMIDGLPAGTEITVAAEHDRFFPVQVTPGGDLGGEVEQFPSNLTLQLQGTGVLGGFQRVLQLPVQCVVHTGPRTAGDPVQQFDNEMVQLQGELPPGDPDFTELIITAGRGFGLPPSPGETTLTQLPNGNFNVDSFFDITYTIDFQGAPGGALDGLSGTTQASVIMKSGDPQLPEPPPPCTVVDNGTGTIDLPPDGCGYVSPEDLHMMIEGLPPDTEIIVDAVHDRFFPTSVTPGGKLNGEVEQFDSGLTLQLQGTGALATFARTIQVPIACEVHTGPRTPGDAVQQFPNEMVQLQGELFGDPDFDFLRVTGGTAFGLPSFGETTLTQLPSGNFNVDSFFDITYKIEFQGAPGSALEGFGGTTQAQAVMTTGDPDVPACGCQLPGDCNGDGLADLSDVVCYLAFFFRGAPSALPCDIVMDCNGDGIIDLADAVCALSFQFRGTAPPVLGTQCVCLPHCPTSRGCAVLGPCLPPE